MNYQRTINSKIMFSGIGLHTGAVTNMNLRPSKENSGIRFKRIDLKSNNIVNASIHNVVDTNRGTTIGENGCKIYTVEHLLSALSGLGIDNVDIDIDNIEPPIFDGSSKVFVEKILNVGIKEYKVQKQVIRIKDSIKYQNNNCKIEIIPNDNFKVSYYGNFNYGNIGNQYYIFSNSSDYVKDISNARTFCSIAELISLKTKGLIKGADLNSGVVFLDDSINKKEMNNILKKFNIKLKLENNHNYTLNNIPLRYNNEPIRHKILDLIGDFFLLGSSIKGHIISHGGGHAANVELMKKIINKYG